MDKVLYYFRAEGWHKDLSTATPNGHCWGERKHLYKAIFVASGLPNSSTVVISEFTLVSQRNDSSIYGIRLNLADYIILKLDLITSSTMSVNI